MYVQLYNTAVITKQIRVYILYSCSIYTHRLTYELVRTHRYASHRGPRPARYGTGGTDMAAALEGGGMTEEEKFIFDLSG